MSFQRTTWVARSVLFLAALWLSSSVSFAQVPSKRYALILEDPPVSSRFASKESVQSAEARNYGQQIEAKQRSLRAELASRDIQAVGSVSTLLNAVFVVTFSSRVDELKSLPGVKGVVPLRRFKLKLNRATQLLNAPAAWSVFGGLSNAGSGIKVGILDTGIDQTHPAFQDKSLPMPAGYPICSGSDCSFTSNKVIVARSYVRQLAAGSSPSNLAADSRPDDYSARDREGHGTAVASCVAAVPAAGVVTINGMAPKAYLGNYKIYGSPTVNDEVTDDVIIAALEDALKDGMDIVSFSSGGPAFTGPLDSGAVCGNATGVPCDPVALAFENAAKSGLVIVAAAGNDGEDGNNYPTFNSVASPGDAPSVISVGATTNSHVFLGSVSVPGAGIPSNLQGIAAQQGDGPPLAGTTTAPLRDVTQLGNDGFACTALPAGSLTGAFALIERGTCPFATKASAAQAAGAVGVIFYMSDSSTLIAPGGLSTASIPAVMISNSDGLAIRSFIDANANHVVTINPTGIEQSTSGFNLLAGFSSFGPTAGDSAIKPDLVAVGTSVYMAVQSYDPLGGELYSTDGYSVADGTSFATPLVSGAAALVKQAHPNFTPAQIKSALVNTASQDVVRDDSGTPVAVQWLGAGKLDAGAAVSTKVTVTPSTLSFGALKAGSLPATRQLQITNTSSSAVTLTIAVVAGNQSAATVSVNQQSLPLAAGATGAVTVTLSGSLPSPGSYYGAVTLQGTGVSLRVPYLFLVGNGVAANITPLIGDFFDGTVGQGIPDGAFAFKLTDAFGVPVSGLSVSWTPRNGGTLSQVDATTDAYGIATAVPTLGSQPGTYHFTAIAGGQTHTFVGTARPVPTIASGGVVNGASFDGTKPVAPGSYISIFGAGLSDTTDFATTTILPLAVDFVTVSFDVPSANISVPGHVVYVSPTQINVQVPWELRGQSSVLVKVTIDFSYGNVVTVPLSDYAPAFFEGGGAVAALDANYSAINSSNPARRGQVIQLYANGLGPVSNQPASGDPAPSAPSLAQTTTLPVVMIGGQQATVAFSGLAPGFPGLYQVNATVPPGLSGAANYPITVSIGGQTSKASSISVQ